MSSIGDRQPGTHWCFNCEREVRWNNGGWWHEDGNMACKPDSWEWRDTMAEPVPELVQRIEVALDNL